MDKLVERLLRVVNEADYPGGHVNGGDGLALNDVAEAATRIQALEAELAGVQAENARLHWITGTGPKPLS